MDFLTGLNNLPPWATAVAGGSFFVALGIFAAWARTFGKKEGPPRPKVQEFYAGGELADMGPVKELVGQTGLLVQQQVRTNLALEAIAGPLTKLVAAYEGKLAEDRNEQEIEDEVQRRLDRQLRERRARARRARKPTAS